MVMQFNEVRKIDVVEKELENKIKNIVINILGLKCL